MRAAAVALVLIVGAAVVLWYGNTLNSWVLGGLIGGLAALLISIPISLLLFSYLARRHDERAIAEAEEEEMSLAAWESYSLPEPAVEVFEAHAYALPALEPAPLLSAGGRGRRQEVEAGWGEEPVDYRALRGRNLPAPSPSSSSSPRSLRPVSYPRLPAARQSPSQALEGQHYQQPKAVPPTHVKGQAVAAQRPHARSGQPVRYPGFPGYRADAQRSALRAARHEASHQNGAGDGQFGPSSTLKPLPPSRPEQRIVAQQPVQPRVPRAARSPQSLQAPQQYRPRHTVEGSSARALARSGEGSTGQLQVPQGRYPRARETQTDKIGGFPPMTDPLRHQTTEQLARNPQLDGRRRNPDSISGSLKNPIVRRAPYMYEDDPLRQEMAQHVEIPLVRRSSRYEDYGEEED
jgi:hypothetical protein